MTKNGSFPQRGCHFSTKQERLRYHAAGEDTDPQQRGTFSLEKPLATLSAYEPFFVQEPGGARQSQEQQG